eukprot:CAMPEP_0170128460 /NCGR_PEP_ID=MMETSP0020_2-20130122/21187_1 /TAXON_ID=98059 /ORGANISM="Dinobryon sp., Strain UTEXLB2267" /LENGTH=150 /DNA_ID=CAMNT_0010362391 /DNA_START=11 /DNA_END=459 /DNA_ORIENTATION=-
MKGCFIFTSSVSGYIPNPFAVMYGATKAFVSQFAASLAIEVRANGIDVLAVHPSPVASNFFDNAHKLDSLEMAQKSAVSPASVPGKMLTCVGRSHLGDLGSMAFIVRMVVAAQKSAVSPASVPGKMLTCVGRSHLGDLGSMAFIVRMVVA